MYKCLHEFFPYKTVPDTSLHKMSDLIEAIENVLRWNNVYDEGSEKTIHNKKKHCNIREDVY